MNQAALDLLWAKFGRDADSARYHPLLCHLIDVASVARAMWQEVLTPALRQRIASGLGIDESSAGAWVVLLAGLHDIGKATPGFQQKWPAARGRLEGAGLRWPTQGAVDSGHGTISTITLKELLHEPFGFPVPVAAALATAVGGHHGILPSDERIGEARNVFALGDDGWAELRHWIALRMTEIVGRPASVPARIDHATAMIVAGLASVADWIGSDEQFFGYAADDADEGTLDLARYAAGAPRKAAAALTQLGWLDWEPPDGPLAFADLFPGIGSPRPVQTEIVALDGILDGPGMVVVELPMGEGKTEAGFFLADCWAARLGQRGAYVAMPTMATSNQMFGRLHDFLAARYPAGSPNLQLLHSQAAISAELEALRAESDVAALSPSEPADHEGAEAAGTVVSAEWFTRRKRGLLAPFGVGTVDQSLLAALQTRHVFVRLFGLAGKTVIFDEVHAYDVYMSTLFERLLEWLGALGSSVIILSATLPRDRRDALLGAYARGAGVKLGAVPRAPYPRLTWLGSNGAGAKPIATSPASRRELHLRWVADDAAELGRQLDDVLAAGGCAAVICNTVGRAQEAYQALKPYFAPEELDLLHARFPFGERDRREQRALARFGKPGGTAARPARAVLVATQIIEQSLDLDFDLMLSDLAPADLILQRSGRLRRHQRGPRPTGERAVLWLIEPRLDGALPRFPGGEFIYDKHVLLRSWLALRGREVIRIPDDLEEIVEEVYDEGRNCPALEGALCDYWATTRQEMLETIAQERDEAKRRLMKSPRSGASLWELTGDPREEDSPEIHQAHQALTRLARPSISIVCLWQTPAGPTLNPASEEVVDPRVRPDLPLTRALLRRAVTISNPRIVWALLEEQPPSGWRRSPLLRHHRAVLFDASGRATVGRAALRLDDELGLLVEPGEGREGE